MSNQNIVKAGAIFLALAVLLGAFGAHILKQSLSPDMMAIYKTGVEYQFYHALGLLLIGMIGTSVKSDFIRWSALLLCIGIILFSGSLYLLAITEIKIIGAVTPVGGISFMAGWTCLVLAVRKHPL